MLSHSAQYSIKQAGETEMSTNTADIQAKIADILQNAGITFSARYVGQTQRENDWDCDEWRIEFRRGKEHFQTAFYTGLGLRETPPWAPGVQGYDGSLVPPPPRTLLHAQWLAQAKPVAPDAAAALHSLLLDAEAIDLSFVDWCSEFGYENDSIKARKMYDECCEIGCKMRKLFDSQQIEQLMAALENY